MIMAFFRRSCLGRESLGRLGRGGVMGVMAPGHVNGKRAMNAFFIEKDAKNHCVTHNTHSYQINRHIFYRLRFLYSRARAQTR
jgi:hypothetical protein